MYGLPFHAADVCTWDANFRSCQRNAVTAVIASPLSLSLSRLVIVFREAVYRIVWKIQTFRVPLSSSEIVKGDSPSRPTESCKTVLSRVFEIFDFGVLQLFMNCERTRSCTAVKMRLRDENVEFINYIRYALQVLYAVYSARGTR